MYTDVTNLRVLAYLYQQFSLDEVERRKGKKAEEEEEKEEKEEEEEEEREREARAGNGNGLKGLTKPHPGG